MFEKYVYYGERKKYLDKLSYYRQCFNLATFLLTKLGIDKYTIFDYQMLEVRDINYLLSQKIITKEEILDVIDEKNYAKLLIKQRFPDQQIIVKHLGPWNELKKESGITRIHQYKRWAGASREILIKLLIDKFVLRQARLPSLEDIASSDELPSIQTFYKTFDTYSWPRILFELIKEMNKLGCPPEYFNSYSLPHITKQRLERLLTENKYLLPL